MTNPSKPIGYWLRRGDELLTARIDEAQRANGIDRLVWQVMNVVREGGATRARITQSLYTFANASAIDNVLRDLARRGLIGGPDGEGYALTAAGEEMYQSALALQTSIREKALAGISPEDYATALAVLERLVTNLEGQKHNR